MGNRTANFRALPIVRPQSFAFAIDVFLDHRIGCIQDSLSAPVVLFKLHGFQGGEGTLHLKDVAYVGTPPPVNTLVVVAHHTEIKVLADQLVDQGVLHSVCVLVLVDQNPLEPLLVFCEDTRELTKDLHRKHQQVAEIQQIAFS